MNRRHRGGGSRSGPEAVSPEGSVRHAWWSSHSTQEVLNAVQARIDEARANHRNVDDEVSSAIRAELRDRGWVVADVRVDLQQAHAGSGQGGPVSAGSPLQGTVTVRATGPDGTAEIHFHTSSQAGANVPETRHMLLPLRHGHVGFAVHVTTPGHEGTFEVPRTDLTRHLHHESAAQRDSRLGEERGWFHRDGYRFDVTLLRDANQPGEHTTGTLSGDAGIVIPRIEGGGTSDVTSTDTITVTRGGSTTVGEEVHGQVGGQARGFPVQVDETRRLDIERHRERQVQSGGDQHHEIRTHIDGATIPLRFRAQVSSDTPSMPVAHGRAFDHLAPPGQRELGTLNKMVGGQPAPSEASDADTSAAQPPVNAAPATPADNGTTGRAGAQPSIAPPPTTSGHAAEATPPITHSVPAIERQPDRSPTADNAPASGLDSTVTNATAAVRGHDQTDAQTDPKVMVVERAPDAASTAGTTREEAATQETDHTVNASSTSTTSQGEEQAARPAPAVVERDPSASTNGSDTTSTTKPQDDDDDDHR